MRTPRPPHTALVTALLALGLLHAPALAQPGDGKPAEQRIDIWTEAKPVLERELKQVAGLTSMTGSYFSRWESQTEGSQPFINDFPVDFALSKPENFYIGARDISVYSNGKTLTLYSKSLKQYISRPAPPVWSLRDTIEELSGGQVRSIPSEHLLRPGMTIEQTLRNVRTMEKTRDADYDGKQGTWVAGTGFDDRQEAALPYTFERFYSSADGLVYCIKQDWTRMYQDMADRAHAEQTEGEANPKPAPKYLTANWTTVFRERKANVEISAETFVFSPGAEDKPVDRFVFPRPNLKEQIALIGQAAPDIIGVDLDGKAVRLADFKGKVVLLDFWATGCGPCVQGLPHMNKLREKYKDQPFVLLGVNRDAPGSASKVKRFLSKRGFTIDQFDDSAGNVTRAYSVNGIPCVVLIDKAGIVQDVDVGYLPGKEKETQLKVDRLLRDRQLRGKDELEKLREQVGLSREPG